MAPLARIHPTCAIGHISTPVSQSPLNPAVVESDIPARLDRLPWSKFHWLIVIALGITWILDGLEVTLAGALGGVLRRPDALGLTAAQVGASATCYLVGAVAGALVFGYLTDRLGRKRLFTVTLLLYLSATALTACSWSFASYAIFRALTGAGIGGEYSAINSAIDELIPARLRGRVDLIINASFWIGAAIGAERDDCVARYGHCAHQPGMAARLWHWRDTRIGHHLPPSRRTGESALAYDSRACRGSGADCGRG